MKPSVGNAPPRRLAPPKRQVQLELRPRSSPGSDDELATQRKSSFWKWVGLVALFHVLVIGLLAWIYETSPTPPPPKQMWSLLPPGDVVKGTAGAQEAPKVGPTTQVPSVAHTPPPASVPPEPATPPPVAIRQPPPEPAPTKPLVASDLPPLVPEKPAPPKPVPAKPKVKVDLTLADSQATDKHVAKPKPHVKKIAAAAPTHLPDREAAANPDGTGLSKAEVAALLGKKLEAAGATTAVKIGASGSDNSHANPFQDFYDSIRDQVMSQWDSPNLTDDTAVNPVVQIHVEKDGRVPPESVTLIQSSGNTSYDNSAVTAAKNLGYLHEPLPDGCPPDIPITFKLTR